MMTDAAAALLLLPPATVADVHLEVMRMDDGDAAAVMILGPRSRRRPAAPAQQPPTLYLCNA